MLSINSVNAQPPRRAGSLKALQANCSTKTKPFSLGSGSSPAHYSGPVTDPAIAALTPKHVEHFKGDGWTEDEILQAVEWGVRSFSKADGGERIGYPVPSPSIGFPHTEHWWQLRLDRPWFYDRYTGEKVELGKYMSPKGAIDESALWMPPGVSKPQQLGAVTEGWKDAFIGTVRGGLTVGAVAGLNHIPKALPKRCGVDTIADSDAWLNADVIGALIAAGLHTGGKVAIVPGDPKSKRGLTEFSSDDPASTAERIQALMGEAQRPKDLFKSWLDFLLANPTAKINNCDDIAHLYRRVAKLAKRLRLSKSTKAWQAQHWATYRRALNRQLQAQQVLSLHDAPVGEYEALEVATGGDRILYALNGQMATAKTSKGAFGAVEHAVKMGQRVLWIVPTQLLSRNTAGGVSDRLVSRGISAKVACHLDESQTGDAHVLVTCGESLHLATDRLWDVVVVDEVNECIPRLLLGTLGKAPKAARAALVSMLPQAQTIIMANDGIYKPVLDLVQRLSGIAPDQVHVIARRRPPADLDVVLYTDLDGYYAWASARRQALEDGEKNAAPTGGQKAGRKMQRWLQASSDKRIEMIDRPDSLPEERAAFVTSSRPGTSGPDLYIEKTGPDDFSWSPVFNSGISIETDYFTRQFEYAAPAEMASSVLQRGARVRAALGGGGLNTRHLFIQDRGMPSQPHTLPQETLGADYWQVALSAPDDATARLLKPLGLDGLADQYRKGNPAPIDEYPELAEMMAIQSREIHFKHECLMDAFEADGYRVSTFEPLPEEHQKAIAGELRDIYETLLDEEGQTYASAPTKAQAVELHPEAIAKYDSGGEPATPTEVRWFDAWRVEETLGAIALLEDKEFWKSCRLEGTALAQAQLNMALNVAWHNRPQFDEWRQWAALKLVATGETPALPVPAWLLEKAALLVTCPGLKLAAQGSLERWSKNTPEVKLAYEWAKRNAEKLTRVTRHSQRIYGLQFGDRTHAVAAFNKLLGELGIEAQADGQVERVHQYRRRTVADVEAMIQEAQKKGQHTGRLERQAYRLEHLPEIVEAAQAQAMQITAQEVMGWNALIERLSEPAQNFSKEDSISTESLCSPPESPPDTLYTPGALVRKVGVTGWKGVFVGLIGATQALVRWGGDAAASLVNLASLEVAA